MQAAYAQIPRFINLARRAALERAVSYRGFNVGAAGMALSFADCRLGYLFGANLTPYQGAPKRCAEMEVMNKADGRGFDWLVALATFGPSDFGDVNAVPTKTLHPCGDCRIRFQSEPTINDETLLITGNETGDIELMFVPEMLDLHR